MHTISNKFDFISYADDTTLISNISKFKFDDITNKHRSVAANINAELIKISNWVAVNAKKCHIMLFRHRQKKLQLEKCLDIEINHTKITMINEFNFLGLTINEHVDWTSHSSKISNKIARTIGVMKKIKSFLPPSILKLLYNSLILPHLYFCITACGFNINRIVKLQKKAIRTISNSKFNAHTEPLFKELRLLKISDIFNLQCLKFYFNVTHRQNPVFFFTFFIQNITVHSHETRQRHHIHIRIRIRIFIWSFRPGDPC